MAGYFGSETQQGLQARAEAFAATVETTPGACQNGRMIGCDDVDAFGAEAIAAVLARDGTCGFRLLTPQKAAEVATWLAGLGYRLDLWDVYVAERDAALSASRAVIDRASVSDLDRLRVLSDVDGADTVAAQALAARCGIAPFSRGMLTGAHGRAVTIALADASGDIVATAHTYLPHNGFSRFATYAWGGLVAVDERHRGRGLGALVNAAIIVCAFEVLGATHVYELVSSSNVPSTRMVQACGLRHDPALVCGAATADGLPRYTR